MSDPVLAAMLAAVERIAASALARSGFRHSLVPAYGPRSGRRYGAWLVGDRDCRVDGL